MMTGHLMTLAAFLEQDLREFYKEESKFIRKMTQKRNEVLLDTVPF
jgi:hypothetical protein